MLGKLSTYSSYRLVNVANTLSGRNVILFSLKSLSKLVLYYSRNDVQHIQRKVITIEDVRYPKPQSKFMERKLFIERRKTLWISLYYLQEGKSDLEHRQRSF